MGYADVSTTMIYLHVMKRPAASALSPRDIDCSPFLAASSIFS
jgi:hypothetical protein